MTVVDNLVLDIIGRESPIVEGISVGETGRSASSQTPVNVPNNIVASSDGSLHGEAEPEPEADSTRRLKKKRSLTAINYEKAERMNELLKLEIAHRKYQILQIELECGLPRSEWTQDLPLPTVKIKLKI
jgi:hypothetical protein